MVILGKGRERESDKLMEMAPEPSKPLHNFTLPRLKWGNQRFLRCMKVNTNGEFFAVGRRSSATEVERDLIGRPGSSDRREIFKESPMAAAEVGGSGRKSKSEFDGGEGIEAIREKLMFDLQTAADKMKDAILRERLVEEPPAAPAEAEAEAMRPWNLRTRRAACKAPNGISGGGSDGGGGKGFQVDVVKPNFSPLRTEGKSPRLRGSVAAGTAGPSGEKRERAKFSVSLSRREIEEDFMAMAGQRLPRRPKKRTKIVQKQLDTIFPGLWLSEVNADFYKVPDDPETGKR